jgi:hypothetical protein
MAEKPPEVNLLEFDKVLARLNKLTISSNSLNISTSERNVSVRYEPYQDAAQAGGAELPALMEGAPRLIEALHKWTPFMASSSDLLSRGRELAIFLYTFRGLSATLPAAPAAADVDSTATEEERAAAKEQRQAAMRDGKVRRQKYWGKSGVWCCLCC